MKPLMDQLVEAIETSGRTRYRIAKESGIAQSQLSRLVSGKCDPTLASVERIAEYLSLEIELRPKRSRKGK